MGQQAGLELIIDAQATMHLSERARIEDWVRETIDSVGMTLLSITGYDLRIAHGQEPGVSVTAIIAESHLALHTWPEHGVVTFNLYSCKPFDVEAVIASFQGFFGVVHTFTQHIIERFGEEGE